MGRCLSKIACPSCGSSDSLQPFVNADETVTGFCFGACQTFIKDPFGGKPPDVSKLKVKTKEEVQAEIDEIRECKHVDFVHRGIEPSDWKDFGVRVSTSQKDGKTPYAIHHPHLQGNKLIGYMTKLIDRKCMWIVGDLREADLYGWYQAKRIGGRVLYITEGQEDAIALRKILRQGNKRQYKDQDYAVVSLPNGTKNLRCLARQAGQIYARFESVVLVFDDDEAGNSAVREAMKILPKATRVTLPAKDANACLVDGLHKQAREAALFRAEKPKNSRIIWGRDVIEDAMKEPKWGVSWPWEGMTKMTRGIRKGETIYIGAGQKMGKSEIVNAIGSHLITEHDWKVLMAKPEEANAKTYKMVASKVAGKFFHDPSKPFDKDALRATQPVLGNNLAMINLYQHLGWDSLKEDIICAAGEGVEAIFIDPITNLTNGMQSAEANEKLQGYAQEWSSMALDLDVAFFMFCHLRNPESGDDHQNGGRVLSSQFAGSRAMARSCNYMLGVEGNKDPDLPKSERNKRRIVLLEDREFGEVGVQELYWDDKTSLFEEL